MTAEPSSPRPVPVRLADRNTDLESCPRVSHALIGEAVVPYERQPGARGADMPARSARRPFRFSSGVITIQLWCSAGARGLPDHASQPLGSGTPDELTRVASLLDGLPRHYQMSLTKRQGCLRLSVSD